MHAILSGTKVLTNSKVDEGRLLRNDIDKLYYLLQLYNFTIDYSEKDLASMEDYYIIYVSSL